MNFSIHLRYNEQIETWFLFFLSFFFQGTDLRFVQDMEVGNRPKFLCLMKNQIYMGDYFLL